MKSTIVTTLTVVFLHVGPKVSLFYAVSKRAVANVLTLLASIDMHTNLMKGNHIPRYHQTLSAKEAGTEEECIRTSN